MVRSTVGVMLAAALGASGLAACTSTAPPPSGPNLTPAALVAPTGNGCAGQIGRFQAVLQSDVDTGNVNRSVYARAEPEITRAKTACDLGQESQALSMLAATKARFGYR